ncbi:unnamed protein product [Effrenium voratum]|nr:unnamed protein product [Effrenium voratum]
MRTAVTSAMRILSSPQDFVNKDSLPASAKGFAVSFTKGAMDNAAGRVQVWARVRPPVEQDHGPCNAVDCCESSKIIRVRNDVEAAERMLTGQAQGESSGEKEFGFDGVFSESTAQRDVFMQIGLPVLREALRGINGTVLAYGQTGSGKTHSLLHQSAKGEEAGLLPRLVASLFLMVSQDVANVYDIEAAAVQVYNEQVDDLLHPDHQGGQGNNLVVRDGGVVNGLTWIRCMKPDEMLEAFTRARANVVYAETKMNKASSRSHAIFQLRISKRERVFEAKGASKVECTIARLNVVDLAGSERVKKSGSEGMRFQEATNINRSLLAFGNVVSALAARKSHVPLRDSKLTRILDGSIGGNCRTALLVCVNPAQEHAAGPDSRVPANCCLELQLQLHAPEFEGDVVQNFVFTSEGEVLKELSLVLCIRRSAKERRAEAHPDLGIIPGSHTRRIYFGKLKLDTDLPSSESIVAPEVITTRGEDDWQLLDEKLTPLPPQLLQIFGPEAPLRFSVNGEEKAVPAHLPLTMSLAEYLRYELGLTGTKIGCGEGGCGACTVLLKAPSAKPRLANACLRPLHSMQGLEVTTVEDVGTVEKPHALQQAFVKHNASQCGMCTPGMVMAIYGHLAKGGSKQPQELQGCIQGNLCRCTGYRPIHDAMKEAAALEVTCSPAKERPIGSLFGRKDLKPGMREAILATLGSCAQADGVVP